MKYIVAKIGTGPSEQILWLEGKLTPGSRIRFVRGHRRDRGAKGYKHKDNHYNAELWGTVRAIAGATSAICRIDL